jgi:transposase-like protein
MNNVRLRGKIPHSEWPRIVERFADGESLTEIARSYGCTAPAIRYIVKRQRRGASSSGESPSRKRGGLTDRIPVTNPPERYGVVTLQAPRAQPNPDRRNAGASDRLWGRVNSDIASFLAAMDDLMEEESEEKELALLDAADRLLRASALTKVEIERLRGSRKRSIKTG